MGLIKAIAGAVGGQLADEWREFFYCDALGADVLVKKGKKRTSKRSSNTKGEDDIISNGSVIAVNEGQAMAIVEQGKVVEFSAEPGEFTWDASTEPSVFYGGFGQGLLDTFKNIGKRFTFGGDTGKDQRVYYFNTKEIVGNKYGTANPVPFRVVDKNINLDIDISVKCFGEYSYKFCDPMIFYTNVCANVTDEYSRYDIDSQLKTELLTALQPAFARISEMGIRYSALPGHTEELADALNAELSEKWAKQRGIVISSFGVSSVAADEEDERIIKEAQRNAINRDPTMAAATMTGATAAAMESAARNENGAPMAFMGMGMAQQAGGAAAANLFGVAQQQQQNAAPAAAGWTCECGQTGNTGKFCQNCGKPAPVASDWTCECGQTGNTGKFCQNCGKPRP